MPCCFTVLSYLRDSLRCKQFLVPFIDSSIRQEEFLKNFTESTPKHLNRSLFHKDVRPWALSKVRHSDTGVFLWIFENNVFFENTTGGCFFIEKNLRIIFFSLIFIFVIKENDNILSISSLPRFPVHNRKLSQEVCFMLPIYYTRLCTWYCKKKATVRFFRKAL